MHKNGYNKYLHGKHRCVSIYPYFTKYGIDNFKIMKIKDYECYRENKADARHLHAFEQLWINKTKGCVNKNYAFSISKLYWKEYRESNKDKISERRKQRVNCGICDKNLARASLQRHMKNIHSSI